jgi:hypothetical protein
MTVSMTVRHEPPGSSPGVCLPLRDHLQKRPQSDLFRRTAHASSDIRIADSLSEVSAVHRLRPAADAPAEGLGSAYWPSPTVADAIVLSSQMAQVLIYHRQGVPREATRTLWMRRVSYQAATAPARLSQPEWNATLRLVSQKKFETAREILNSARVAASLSGGIELEADLAYFDAAGSAEPSAG